MPTIKKSQYIPTMKTEMKTGAFWRDCFAEMVATFLLVTAQLLLLLVWTPDNPSPEAHAIQVAMGMAFVVGSAGYAIRDFGAAHMNPAVTVTMVIRAEITVVKGIIYWIVQLAGSILASFYVYAITPSTQLTNSKLGNTMLASGVLWWQGLLIEMTITGILCMTIVSSLNIARKGYIVLPSIPVGMALGLGLFLALSPTGASMNPARSLGPCVVGHVMMDMSECWSDHWIYWVGPLVGALLAAMFYWIFDVVDRPADVDTYYVRTQYPTVSTGQPYAPDKLVYPSNGYLYQ